MNPATSKAAQSGTVRKTCEGCGQSKDIADFPLHPRWKRPISKCDTCMAVIRAAGDRKRSATAKAKAKEKARTAAKEAAIAKALPAPVTDEVDDKGIKPNIPNQLAIVLAKLEGYALATKDAALDGLLAELKEAVV